MLFEKSQVGDLNLEKMYLQEELSLARVVQSHAATNFTGEASSKQCFERMNDAADVSKHQLLDYMLSYKRGTADFGFQGG